VAAIITGCRGHAGNSGNQAPRITATLQHQSAVKEVADLPRRFGVSVRPAQGNGDGQEVERESMTICLPRAPTPSLGIRDGYLNYARVLKRLGWDKDSPLGDGNHPEGERGNPDTVHGRWIFQGVSGVAIGHRLQPLWNGKARMVA